MPKRPGQGGTGGLGSVPKKPRKPLFPKGEEPGGRGGNPAAPKPPIGIGNGPGHPHAVPKAHQPYDAYAASVQQNLQYLTTQQRAEAQKRQSELSALKQQAKIAAKQRATLRDLREKGAQGVRAQQALLRKAGYNVTVDGKYGQQTENALRQYLTTEEKKWSDKLVGKATFAHPMSVRAEANSKFTPQKITNNRNFILGYVSQQQRDLRAAKADIEKKVRNGDVKAKDTLASINAAIKGLDGLRVGAMKTTGPGSMDATDLNRTMLNIIEKQKNELDQATIKAKSQDPTGFSTFGEGIATIESLIGHEAMALLNTATVGLFNRGSAAFAAGFETGLHTGNYGKALEAFAGSFLSFVRVPMTDISLVGVIAPGGSEARKFIEATNTQEEMDRLVKEGDLLSFGQTIQGHVTSEFAKKHPLGLGGAGTVLEALGSGDIGIGVDASAQANVRAQSETKVFKGFDWMSALGDTGSQLIKDPTLAVGFGIEAVGANLFGNVESALAKKGMAEAVARFGEDGTRQILRAFKIEGTPTGRALLAKVDEVVGHAYSAYDIEKAIHGIPADIAHAAMLAKETDGAAAASAIIKSSFIDGTWDPHISFVRKITNDIGARIGLIAEDGTAGKLLGIKAELGGKAIKTVDRLAAVRQFAGAKGPIAATFERDATVFVDEALRAVTSAERSTVNGLWDRLVSGTIKGLDFEGRFYNVMQKVYDIENPALHAAFEGNMRKFFTNPELLDHVPLVTYMESAFNQDGFELALRKMETLAAVASGEGVGAAQFAADLARGFRLPKNAVKEAFQSAAQNLGLKLGAAKKGATRKGILAEIKTLPTDDQAFFRDRLLALKGKTGLGRLATDVELAKKNPALRAELKRLLEQQQGRAEQFAAGAAGKRGLLKRVVRLPAKLVLSNVDTAPPTELLFKYDTKNSLQHAYQRARAAERYLEAGYVPRTVRETLIRAAERVQSEEELFAVRDRIVKAVLESMGIEHPDAMMALLDARGTLKSVARTPLRAIFKGEKISDLQTLAQRVERARMPRPAELAIEYRKAIVDGIEDASVARRIAATVRVDVLDNLGKIKLHFTHLDGRVMTVSSSFASAHRAWKFLIVTNAGLPIIGATAGFVGTQGGLGDRFKNAGLGFAFGSLGGVRYVARIAGIEERSRMLLNEGLNSEIHIPGWAKIKARRAALGDPTRRTMSYELVKTGRLGQGEFDNELLTHVDKDWVEIKNNDARAVDAWHRIINDQVHPESDPVVNILAHEHAGLLDGTEEVTRVVKVERAIPKEVVSVLEDNRTPLQKAADEAAAAVNDNGVAKVVATNEDLLADHAGAATKTFWRGEDGNYATRGDGWIPESYNKGRGEQYARGHAGENGRVFKVELPVDEHGVPVVGEIATEGNMGWVLAGNDAKWADAAVEQAPPGMAGTLADKATYKTVTETIQVTGKESADRQIAAFLETEEGQIWAARWRGAKGGASPKQAVKRIRNFLETYSTPELSLMRVKGGVNGVPARVERDTLKRMLKSGLGPDSFHAQQTWKMPRSIGDVFHVGARIENKFVLAGPSNFFNRGPYYRSLFEREYDRLLLNGVEHARAQELADVVAERQLNHVLDRMDDPSRFARKVDSFLPFQQAREDTVRAYGSLIRAHPIHALQIQSHVARLFNDGKDMGIFTKNSFTGQWQMTVPGSARLARTLFKLPLEANWTFNLNDLLFVGNGAYGQGFMPTLGGPFWGVAAKLLADARPDLFTGNNPIQDWLWSYGKGGVLLRKDNSRLWMAFTGTTPPWEAFTQDAWKNEHNKWQTEVTQQLIFQHRKKDPTNLDWFPTDEEVKDATKKFYETWAFIGSTFPATSYPTLTGKSKYWSARNAFTVGGILPWDPQAFLAKYPEFVPYTVGPDAKYVGPDDPASLQQFNVGSYNPLSTFDPKTGQWTTSTGGKPGEDTMTEKALGYRLNRSFEQFKDDFKFYKRQGEFFTKLEDARALQKLNPLAGERALSELNKNYSDVVKKGRRTYDIKTDLYNINWQYPKQLRAAAIARVKAQYGLSGADLTYFMAAAQNPDFMPNAWREARLGSDIEAEVRLRFGGTITGGKAADTAYAAALDSGDVAKYVATLQPAEQANYWKYQAASLGYDPNLDDPSKVVAKYTYLKKQLNGVYKEYPWLFNSDKNFSQGTRTTTVAKAYKYPTITVAGAEDAPGGAVQITDATNMARFTMPQVKQVGQALYDEIARLFPQYTKDVKIHFLRSSDKEWKAVDGGAGAIARGSASGQIWVNLDAIKSMPAKTVRFVLAKELGQANVNKFIKTKEGAALYHKLLGYKGKVPDGTTDFGPHVTKFLGLDVVQRSKNGGSTNPADWFGRDFANALGFHSPEPDSNFTPAQIQQLQDAGILPPEGRIDTLTGKAYENPFQVAVNKIQDSLYATANSTYASIDKVKAEMDAAAKAKNWKAFYALKASESQLFDVAEAVNNRLRQNLPDLTKYYDDVHAAALAGAAGNAPERDHWLHQAAIDKANAPYFLISEERRFLNYPPAVQRAYSATLVQALDMPTGKNDYDVMQYIKSTTGLTKKFWEYLSPFQQDLLERNFPQLVDKWKYQSDWALHGPGAKNKGAKQVIPTELQWAYNQLVEYNKRGEAPRPDSYNQYLRLPANVAVREQFLAADKPLRDYLNNGPLANMPETMRDSIVSILTKYGNYNANSGSGGGTGYQQTGGSGGGYRRGGGRGTHIKDRGLGYEGNVNVAWAKEQLYIWSRRKDVTKPSNYDAWVNMPTGVEKAQYLDSHPELQNWIKLGPMANMPEEYKAMVRDIMQRYGEWTQKNDPLANTITEFFKTPGYARQDFLALHPELEAYWAASRSPEEQAKFDLRNEYFKIQDVAARQAFLSMHPDLQQDFVDSRTKRYESFLNQVAVYMGANPNMFQDYLTRQTDIMAELLKKYAEPHLIREVGPGYVATATDTGTRQRAPQGAPRVRTSA